MPSGFASVPGGNCWNRSQGIHKIGSGHNFSSPAVDEKLKVLIRDYIYKKGEILDDDSLVTLKLGYENT